MVELKGLILSFGSRASGLAKPAKTICYVAGSDPSVVGWPDFSGRADGIPWRSANYASVTNCKAARAASGRVVRYLILRSALALDAKERHARIYPRHPVYPDHWIRRRLLLRHNRSLRCACCRQHPEHLRAAHGESLARRVGGCECSQAIQSVSADDGQCHGWFHDLRQELRFLPRQPETAGLAHAQTVLSLGAAVDGAHAGRSGWQSLLCH